MAIPDSPNWSALTNVKADPQPAFIKPIAPIDIVYDISLGPINLNNSQGLLNKRYWLITQDSDNGNILIAGSNGDQWEEAVLLFTEVENIVQMALTFDQLGRPIVFYQIGLNDLKLYWYDPLLEMTVNVSLTTGTDPLAGFDFPQDTGQSFTDALLFYVRANTIYMREQRDRYEIEYICPANENNLNILSTGLRIDNKYQVVYNYLDLEYIPPFNPPITENNSNFYLLKQGNCLVTNYNVNVVESSFKIGFKTKNSLFPRYTENTNKSNAFKQGQSMFGTNDRRQFFCYIERDTRNNQAIINLWRGGDELNAIFQLDDFNGEWEFEFNGLSPIVTIKKDGLTLFSDFLATPMIEKSKISVITFGGSIYSLNTVNTYNYNGCVYDCWIEDASGITSWAVQSTGLAIQPSVPAGTNMTITNHTLQNWVSLKAD